MAIEKSSRHQKIIGDFGESLICNWLSRSGFEVTIVDHTGIDIVAYDKKTERRMGISVKSRTRNVGKENVPLVLMDADDKKKVIDACIAFCCEPWIGIYVENDNYADLYLLRISHLEEKYARTWNMGRKKESYLEDPEILHIRLDFEKTRWFV